MRRVLLAIVLAFGFVSPVWADFQAGLDASKRGDFTTALREWKPLAEAGNADAQYNLGYLYEKGQGVAKDFAEAMKWYGKAADQGDARALGNIGYLYEKGRLGDGRRPRFAQPMPAMVLSMVVRGYDLHKLGGHLGNVG